jgi:hypothetical protein
MNRNFCWTNGSSIIWNVLALLPPPRAKAPCDGGARRFPERWGIHISADGIRTAVDGMGVSAVQGWPRLEGWSRSLARRRTCCTSICWKTLTAYTHNLRSTIRRRNACSDFFRGLYSKIYKWVLYFHSRFDVEGPFYGITLFFFWQCLSS